MLKYIFSKYPLFIYLIPIILGILMSEMLCVNWIFPLLIIIIGIVLSIIKCKSKLSAIRTIIFLSVLFIISFINSEINIPTINDIPDGQKLYLRIDECSHRDTNTKIIGELIGDDAFESQDVLIYIDGNNYNLKPGVIISFYSDFDKISNLGNPCEFDYSGYMNRNGIFYEQFLKRNEYYLVGEAPTIINYATLCRNSLINKVFNSNISVEGQEFLIAILLGDKQFLDADIKDKFSKIGIAHILALSGLHIGIIGLIVYFILFPLDYFGLRKYRLIISIIILMIYAFVTGCSPSVMRALLMFIFASISIIIYRKNNVLNSVFGSAILILLISPIQLYDVGFQLSFLAVISIILFTPVLNPLKRNNSFYILLNYLFVSVAAMLGTGILSCYYFGVAPTLFIIPNILIIPILPIILLDGILILITDFGLFTYVFDNLYNIIIDITTYIENLSFSNYIVNLNLYQCLSLYLAVTSFFIFLKFKKKNRIKYIAESLILLSIVFTVLLKDIVKSSNLIIFNDYKETPILINKSGEYNMLSTVDCDYIENFREFNKKFLSEYGIFEVDISELYLPIENSNIIYFNSTGKRFAVLDSTLPGKGMNLPERMDFDYLIVTKNCYSSLDKILKIYNPRNIIISGNIFDDRRLSIIKYCKEFGIKYYDIKSQGAFILD